MNRRTPLLIIDVQNAFNDPSWGRRNNENAERNIARDYYFHGENRDGRLSMFRIYPIILNPYFLEKAIRAE